MIVLIVSIEINQVTVFVGLIVLNQCLVLLKRKIFSVHILHQRKVLSTLVEVFLRQHSVVDEQFQGIPFLFVFLTVLFEDAVKPVGHFLSDVGRDFLYVAVALQITTAHIQRDIGRVNHTMQQRKEVGHNAFHLVGDKHLVAVKLYLIALQLDIRFDSREKEDTSKVERIVNVEVNPEQRLLHLHGIECAIEALVVLVFQCAGRFGPEWFHIIYNIVLVGINLLAVFPFGLLAEGNWNGQELTILIQQLLYFLFLKKLLAVVIDVKNNIRTTVSALGILDGKFW